MLDRAPEDTLYPYSKAAAQDRAEADHHPVIVVGAGPVGLALALDLAAAGVGCLVLDDQEGVGAGSRAICFAKRTLEICDRLGAGGPMVDEGVVWQTGRVYRGAREIYAFDLLPEAGHERPAFINLQQPRFERYLVDALRRAEATGAPVEIRGGNRVTSVDTTTDGVTVEIATPDGPYRATADYLVACDGARSPLREMLGEGFDGRVFEDNFLIADIKIAEGDFPTERRFWFDPPFNRGQTALMHKQPDGIWRLDFQLGWEIDRDAELDPDRIRSRVRAMIGDIPFELDWCSIYTFRCCSMEAYRHGRLLFAGDAAHQVSPFGARGCNGGVQDADNLGWKLAHLLKGQGGPALLESYDTERMMAARENILNSTRTADFLTPRRPVHALFRDAVLDLAETHAFARPMVNSGRLSAPCTYDGSPLNSADGLPLGPTGTRPGSACADAPLADGYLLRRLGGRFTLLTLDAEAPDQVSAHGVVAERLALNAAPGSDLAKRYLGDAPHAVYLIRPDQHVAARWPIFDGALVEAALGQALGHG
ncbi:MAG: FAD-dependent oxidoreductase [Pseudomonadota bacterium]